MSSKTLYIGFNVGSWTEKWLIAQIKSALGWEVSIDHSGRFTYKLPDCTYEEQQVFMNMWRNA